MHTMWSHSARSGKCYDNQFNIINNINNTSVLLLQDLNSWGKNIYIYIYILLFSVTERPGKNIGHSVSTLGTS